MEPGHACHSEHSQSPTRSIELSLACSFMLANGEAPVFSAFTVLCAGYNRTVTVATYYFGESKTQVLGGLHSFRGF